METRFTDQVAIVTGGAMGLGKAITKRLASEGASVYILDRDTTAMEKTISELRSSGLKVDGVQADISQESSTQHAFDEVLGKEGKVSAVVHGAAIIGPNGKKALEISQEDFENVMRVNLTGSFIVAKQAIRVMLPKSYGRILLVASISGKEGNPGMSPYSVSKAGVICIAKALAKEYAETGITINSIAPAVVRTPMVDSMDPAQVKWMTDKIPMKRCGELDEVASLCAWIVSPEASFNTGFCFDLTGGRAVY